MKLRPLSPEELSLSYSKYYFWPDPVETPLSSQILRAPIDPADALPVTQLRDMLKPGYMPAETGYCNLPDGTAYYAYYLDMPGCTVDMIDWWFIWHFVGPNRDIVPKEHGNLRYKIWCPRLHRDTGYMPESMPRILDNSIPLRARRYGTLSYITEAMNWYLPDDVGTIESACQNPIEFGFTAEDLSNPANGSIITAGYEGSDTVVFFQYRPNQTGVEMRFRQYKGVEFRKGEFVKHPLPEPIPNKDLRTTLIHTFVENARLVSFLPSLYAEEGKKALDIY